MIADPDKRPLLSIAPHAFKSSHPYGGVTTKDVHEIVCDALTAPRLRSRICGHESHDQSPQEMLICLALGTYIRPHRHHGRVESGLALEGLADVVIFNEQGVILDTWSMGPMNSGHRFFYRFNEPCFHTLLIRSKVFIFHEVSTGPHNPQTTEFADWAPDDSDKHKISSYITGLENQIRRWRSPPAL